MNEVAIFRQMKNIAKGDLEDNEEFVMLKDYKDLKQQLQVYKEAWEELMEWLNSPVIRNRVVVGRLEWTDINFKIKELLQILNEGSDK